MENFYDIFADFYDQWLGADGFSGLARETDTPGVLVEGHNQAWRQSLENFAQRTFWEEGGTLEALLTSNSVLIEDAATAVCPTRPARHPSRRSELRRGPPSRQAPWVSRARGFWAT